MLNVFDKSLLKAFGADARVAFVRWTPSGATTQTLTEAEGVTSVTRNGPGDFRINLAEKCGHMAILLGYVENDTTHYHFVTPVSSFPTLKRVDIKHQAVTYASAASGPTDSDTIDELQAMIIQWPSTQLQAGQRKHLKAYGPQVDFAYARWTPSTAATQTLAEAQGIRSITQSSTGLYTVNLARSGQAMLAFVRPIENDTTHYHFAEVTGTSTSAKTVSLRHRSVAYASVASGPGLNDTVDQMEVFILQRVGV